jgi:uncharacterized YigZ family protein
MSLFDDTYKTISKPSEGTFRDKGSKFIAYAYPFRDENELKDLLASVKSEHPKARHWCYAYRLSPDRTVFRVNDDGEPSGSAGRPILNTLLSNDLTDIIVIVVRYFGGTLLGIPGLINAYKNATQEALDVAEIIERTQEDVYKIDFDYLQMNDVMRIIKEDNLEILKQDFDNRCSITFSVRKLHVNQVVHKMEGIENSKLIFCMPS